LNSDRYRMFLTDQVRAPAHMAFAVIDPCFANVMDRGKKRLISGSSNLAQKSITISTTLLLVKPHLRDHGQVHMYGSHHKIHRLNSEPMDRANNSACNIFNLIKSLELSSPSGQSQQS
jgi:hypothetical protein